jgi:excisionase family DNA binding protein
VAGDGAVDAVLTLSEVPDVLTVRELCLILRIGRNQAYALVNSGRLGPCRVGGSIRVPKAAVERFLLGQPAYSLTYEGRAS